MLSHTQDYISDDEKRRRWFRFPPRRFFFLLWSRQAMETMSSLPQLLPTPLNPQLPTPPLHMNNSLHISSQGSTTTASSPSPGVEESTALNDRMSVINANEHQMREWNGLMHDSINNVTSNLMNSNHLSCSSSFGVFQSDARDVSLGLILAMQQYEGPRYPLCRVSKRPSMEEESRENSESSDNSDVAEESDAPPDGQNEDAK